MLITIVIVVNNVIYVSDKLYIPKFIIYKYWLNNKWSQYRATYECFDKFDKYKPKIIPSHKSMVFTRLRDKCGHVKCKVQWRISECFYFCTNLIFGKHTSRFPAQNIMSHIFTWLVLALYDNFVWVCVWVSWLVGRGILCAWLTSFVQLQLRFYVIRWIAKCRLDGSTQSARNQSFQRGHSTSGSVGRYSIVISVTYFSSTRSHRISSVDLHYCRCMRNQHHFRCG